MRSVFMRFFSGRNHALGLAWVNTQNTPVAGGALAVVATVMPMMADGHRHDGMQLEPGHGGNDVEPDLALDAHRLEGE